MGRSDLCNAIASTSEQISVQLTTVTDNASISGIDILR